MHIHDIVSVYLSSFFYDADIAHIYSRVCQGKPALSHTCMYYTLSALKLYTMHSLTINYNHNYDKIDFLYRVLVHLVTHYLHTWHTYALAPLAWREIGDRCGNGLFGGGETKCVHSNKKYIY